MRPVSQRDDYCLAESDFADVVERSLHSRVDAGWSSVVVQSLKQVHAEATLVMPASADLHLWLVVGGAGSLHLDYGDGWTTTKIVPGRVGVTAPGVPVHVRYETVEPMRSLHVHLPAGVTDPVTVGARSPVVGDLGAESSALLGAVIRSLATATTNGYDEMYADTAAQFLAVHLATAAERQDPPGRLRNGDLRVRRAIGLMHDRIAGPLRLAELAAEAGLSKFHFLRVFRDVTGMTPGRYLTLLRVERATSLLDGGMPVTQVAQRCGFSSPGHFSAAYLRETGARPSTRRPN